MSSAPPHLQRPALTILLLSLVLSGLQLATLPRAAQAAGTCTTSTVARAYTATVCLTAPDGALAGDVALSATVVIAAGPGVAPPSVSKVIFFYRDEYLLSDHDAGPDTSYGMTWRTTRMVDGPGQLTARARLSDDVVAEAGIPVTLANGAVLPVGPREFSVRHGAAPAPGQRFRLAAVGDGADGSPREAAVTSLIASWDPSLLAYLGDVYERGSTYEFDNWFGQPTGYGRFQDITNPTIGNHEYLTEGAAGYFDFWGTVPHYYSYDVAGWHLVSIDSNVEYGQLRPGSAQFEWLAADLAANRAHCTMVYMHHPRYSVAQGGGRSGLGQVWSLLAARRVTLAVAGHAHSYERWLALDGSGAPDERGVTQLVAGAGGREVTPGVRSDARLASSAPVSGALRLDLGAEDVSFAYVGVDGVDRDGGTISCKSTGDTLPPTTPSGLLAGATSSTAANLSWQPSTDQNGTVAGYTVRRNGVAVASLGAAETSYADGGLVSGSTYSWTVDAFDTSANYSAQSAPAAVTMPAPAPPSVSTRTLLRALARSSEHPRGYDRSRFRTWTDADGDGCSTRSEVLLTEAVRPPTVLAGCALSGGRWFSRYDGVATTSRSRLRIEHLVPLKEAWRSGAHRWSGATRSRLANDLGYEHSLAVATSKVLRARGSSGPQDWMPPQAPTRCGYVAHWVAVKWRWHLRVDSAERRFLVKRLSACGWPTVDEPTRPAISRR